MDDAWVWPPPDAVIVIRRYPKAFPALNLIVASAPPGLGVTGLGLMIGGPAVKPAMLKFTGELKPLVETRRRVTVACELRRIQSQEGEAERLKFPAAAEFATARVTSMRRVTVGPLAVIVNGYEPAGVVGLVVIVNMVVELPEVRVSGLDANCAFAPAGKPLIEKFTGALYPFRG
jgi:hypothetical protein